MWRTWMIFPKALLGGLAAVIVVWIVIIIVSTWREAARQRAAGYAGPFAVAGGWSALLHSPTVAMLLAAAFGIGLYLAARH